MADSNWGSLECIYASDRTGTSVHVKGEYVVLCKDGKLLERRKWKGHFVTPREFLYLYCRDWGIHEEFPYM